MKFMYLLTGVLICCCSFSNCDETEDFTCVEFKDQVATLEPDPVQAKNYINAMLALFSPNPTTEDPIGHDENLIRFADRLEEHCDVDALIECYACIETFPHQSHVLIRLDSAGMMISRTLDIRTPGDTLMTLLGIHR